MTWKSKKISTPNQTELHGRRKRRKKKENNDNERKNKKTVSLLASKCDEFGNFLAKLATKTDHENGIRQKRLFPSSNYGSDL